MELTDFPQYDEIKRILSLLRRGRMPAAFELISLIERLAGLEDENADNSLSIESDPEDGESDFPEPELTEDDDEPMGFDEEA